MLPCPPDHAVHVYIMTVDLRSETGLKLESAAHIATLEIDDESRVVVVAKPREWAAGAEIVERQRSSPTSRQLGTGGLTTPSDATRWLLHGTHTEGGGKFIIDAAGLPSV